MSEFATDDRMDVPPGLKSVLENSISKLSPGEPALSFVDYVFFFFFFFFFFLNKGRLKIVQDFVAAYFQPSLRDW